MGILSLSQGNADPYDLDSIQLARLQDLLLRLRPQIASIQPNPGQVLADLRSGAVWVAPGIGEWAAAALAAQGLPIDWTVPPSGGIMWVEAFALASDSKHPQLAERFLRQVMTPRYLALLATRKAYYSQITRRSAYQFVPDKAKRYLKADSLDYLNSLANSLQFRRLPGPKTSENDWIAAWTKFKSAK
jgi:spermidine/putrescine transport system substrate-binding protein